MRYSLHVCVHLHLSDSASVRACSGHSYPFHLGSKTQRRVFLINAVCASRRARRQTHKTSGAQSGANAMNISRSFTAVPSSRGSRQLRISSRSQCCSSIGALRKVRRDCSHGRTREGCGARGKTETRNAFCEMKTPCLHGTR